MADIGWLDEHITTVFWNVVARTCGKSLSIRSNFLKDKFPIVPIYGSLWHPYPPGQSASCETCKPKRSKVKGVDNRMVASWCPATLLMWLCCCRDALMTWEHPKKPGRHGLVWRWTIATQHGKWMNNHLCFLSWQTLCSALRQFPCNSRCTRPGNRAKHGKTRWSKLSVFLISISNCNPSLPYHPISVGSCPVIATSSSGWLVISS